MKGETQWTFAGARVHMTNIAMQALRSEIINRNSGNNRLHQWTDALWIPCTSTNKNNTSME